MSKSRRQLPPAVKLLNIRIPMAPPNAIVGEEQDGLLRRASLEEMYRLIPGLAELKGSIPGIGVQAHDDQICLTLTLATHPQLPLRLEPKGTGLGRVVELESAAVDQKVIKDSFRLTQDLLARVGEGLPEAMAEWLERFARSERGRARNRLRRELGRRYELSIFNEPEVVGLPELDPVTLDSQTRTIALIVTEMYGKRSFQADHLQDITVGASRMAFDPRQVLTLVCRGDSMNYNSSAMLHRAMYYKKPVEVTGRMVLHVLHDSPIAMEVDQVSSNHP